MNTNITFAVRRALTKDETHSSESIARLILEAQTEAERLSNTLDADQHVLANIEVSDEEHEAARQRIDASDIVYKRLVAALPRLIQLQTDIAVRERDETQRLEYKNLVKRRGVVAKQLDEFLANLPAVATALHEAVQLQVQAKRFNTPARGSFVNPIDNIVGTYEHLQPIVTDAVLKRTTLVGSDGIVLFAPIDTNAARKVPTIVKQPLGGTLSELEVRLRDETERQTHSFSRLRELRIKAASKSVSIEHIAGQEGITAEKLLELNDAADPSETIRLRHLVNEEKAAIETAEERTS